MQPHKNDWKNLQEYFDIFQTLSQNFIEQIDKRKVAKLDASLSEKCLPNDGLDMRDLVNTLESHIVPQLSGSRGARYWGLVTGGATPIATMADWLVATFDQNVAKGGDSIASLMENQAIEWLLDLFDLPKDFKGVMPTGATACNFLGACMARQFAGEQQGVDVAKEGVYDLDIEIFSTTPHASMVKSLGMAGLGQRHLTKVDAEYNSERMDTEHLKLLLENSGSKAKVVIASSGTVTGTDFDNLNTITKLCEKHNAWLHVDAAFGLFERVVNGDGKTKGIELADSITVDCHKWLNVPYDCGVFLTRHLNALEKCFDVPAPYLVNATEQPDFMSLGIENSRRFRAFPVWLSLLAYGKQGIKNWVKSNIELSKKLAEWIDHSIDYELVYPCQMNVVLFRPNCDGLSQEEADLLTDERLNAINQDGRLFLSPGSWQGHHIIRAALSNWETDEGDIKIAQQVLTDLS